MKKFTGMLSLALTGALLFSMPVMAEETDPPDITAAANAENKSVQEYMANAVTKIASMNHVIPVGQGGNVILDGQKSNVTFPVMKPDPSYVYSAKEYAASLGGTVLNVVKIETHVSFDVANVNFYMPGITGEENIHVSVYSESTGSWTELPVTEKRADHIIVDMTGTGVLAFMITP